MAWIIVLAILAAAVFVFVSVFYEDTKKKLDEMNYPRTYSTYVEKAAKDYDLDPALIYAVIHFSFWSFRITDGDTTALLSSVL